jgi:hypothetical protein
MFKHVLLGAVGVLALPALVATAAPKDDVQAAAKKLADTGSYTWHSATEGGFSSTTDGKIQKDGTASLKLTFGDNTREVLIKGDKAAVKTDDGWKSSAELQDAQGPERFLARMATGFRAPATQAEEMVAKTKELKKGDDNSYSADLTEEGAKDLMTLGRRRTGDANQQGPQISGAKGNVKFWTKDGALSKMQYTVEGKMNFNGEDRDVNRTTTVDITDVGSTKVEIPADAKAKLE